MIVRNKLLVTRVAEWFVILILSIFSIQAWAASQPDRNKAFKFLLGVNTGKSAVSGDSSFSYQFGEGPAFHLGFDYDFLPAWGFSVGATYLGRVSKITDSTGATGKIKINYLLFPATLRWIFLEYAHLGLGGYLGFEMGSVTISSDATGSSVDGLFTGNALDAGLVFNFGMSVPLTDNIDLAFDMEPHLGLADATQLPTATWKYIDVLLMIGARYVF